MYGALHDIERLYTKHTECKMSINAPTAVSRHIGVKQFQIYESQALST